MDISGAIASVLWSDTTSDAPAGAIAAGSDSGCGKAKQRRPAQTPHPQHSWEAVCDDLARLVTAEREARKNALVEAQKQLDWRFVHFAEEFQRRLDGLEGRLGGAGGAATRRSGFLSEQERASSRLASLDSERLSSAGSLPEGRAGCDEQQRLHLLEGKVAIAESRLAEVQRWGKAMEAQLASEKDCSARQLQELEAYAAHLERRLGETELRLGGRRGATERLTPVERLSVDGHCSAQSAQSARSTTLSGQRSSQTSEQSAHSTGSGSTGRRADTRRLPLSPSCKFSERFSSAAFSEEAAQLTAGVDANRAAGQSGCRRGMDTSPAPSLPSAGSLLCRAPERGVAAAGRVPLAGVGPP